jgi:branched-chain amino acid transport system substrate-binding protein
MGSCLALGLGLAAPASSEELRIGYISPVTGIFAQVGKDMVDGFQMYLDEHGGKLGGMDVKFIVEDDQGKPDAGVTKAKKLILQDKVHMFIGGLLASTGYALAPISTSEKTLYISSVSSAYDLTQRQLSKYPYFVRIADLFPPAPTAGAMACDNGFKKVIRSPPTMVGYETAGGSRSLRIAAAVVQKIWPPLAPRILALHPDLQGRCGRDLHHHGQPMALQFRNSCAAPASKLILGSGVAMRVRCRSWR